MSTVVSFFRPTSKQRAEGVFAAVNITARRLGLSDADALREASNARAAYTNGRQSAARVVSRVTAALRCNAEQVSA